MRGAAGSFTRSTAGIALIVALVVVGTATAGQLITGADIKNGTLTLKDFKKSERNKLKGAAGPQGAQGPAGAAGANGAAGPAGPAGATGQPGAAGATGAKGATGATGQAGATGATGAKGATGTTGTAGVPGQAGPAASNMNTGNTNIGVVPFQDVVSVSLTLPAAGKVMLIGTSGWFTTTAPMRAACQLEEGTTALTPVGTEYGETTDTTTSDSMGSVTVTHVTDALAAGAHTFDFSCAESAGDGGLEDSAITAVYVGA